MTAEQAVRAGFDEIQHVNFLFLNFLDGVDTRTPARLTAVGEHGGELDLKAKPVRAFLRLLKERGTVIDPTVNVFEEMFVGHPGEVTPSLAAVASRLPLQVQRGLRVGDKQLTPEMAARYRDSFRALLAMTKALHDTGIPLVAGTDSAAGFSLHRELRRLRRRRPHRPRGPARRHPRAGAGDAPRPGPGHHRPRQARRPHPRRRRPAARITDLRRVVLTIKGGVMIDTAKVYEVLGVKAGE